MTVHTKNTTALLCLLHIGVFAALVVAVVGQNCGNNGCGKGLCCSRWGYCGTDKEFCGDGCQSGPCYNMRPTNNTVSYYVSDKFFNSIIEKANSTCAGKSFYSRAKFLEAVGSYPMFGMGDILDSKHEIAAFFAHVTYETDHFCNIEAGKGSSWDSCDKNNTQYPCVAGKAYYGRGPIGLSWNYNYGPAGESIGFDGLKEPEKVAIDPLISFKTALWYWMENGHPIFTSFRRHVFECSEKKKASILTYYWDYCAKLGVLPDEDYIGC